MFKRGQKSTIKKGPSQGHNFGPILRAKMAPLNLLCVYKPAVFIFFLQISEEYKACLFKISKSNIK